MITIKTTTDEIFRNFMEITTDIMSEGDNDPLGFDENVTLIRRIGKPLILKDMNAIRKNFIDGYVPVMVPHVPGILENNTGIDKSEVEIRIYDGDKLLGVIIDSEIKF